MGEPDLIRKRLDYIEGNLADLRDQVERRITINSEKIGVNSAAIKELQIMLYGEEKFKLIGLGGQIERLSNAIEVMQTEREALRNQIKGMSLMIKLLVGLVSSGSLAAVGILLEWLSQ